MVLVNLVAAEVLGDHARVADLRRENGAVTAWTLAGPFGRHRNLDLDRTFPPDEGTLPESVPGPLGGPARRTRVLPAPDGAVVLDGEGFIRVPGSTAKTANTRFIARSCLNCHNAIHGSNAPATRGKYLTR